MYNTYSTYATTGTSSYLTVVGIISLLVAIAATVLAFIFIVPEKKKEKLNAFGKFLHKTVNFKYLIIEKILQALYIFSTAYVILYGFFMLFYVQKGFYGNHWYGGYGILVIILGPIIVRLVYEALMMGILLVKNVISINNRLSDKDTSKNEDLFNMPEIPVKKPKETPVVEENATTNNFCTKCGAKLDENGKCPNCDK